MFEYTPQFFQAIHSECHPIGSIGRGAHYSVFRCACWHDHSLTPLETAQVQDFALIWDEDHDQRVLPVVERIYLAGLLSPIQFLGERKATLSVVISEQAAETIDLQWYRKQLTEIVADVGGDYWYIELGVGLQNADSIISDNSNKVKTYLTNIDNIWQLGLKSSSLVTKTVNWNSTAIY